MKCRHCKEKVDQLLIDLGDNPPSNSYIDKYNLKDKEKKYPLKVYVCNNCWLVQTLDTAKKQEFFSETYAYLSSYSKTWIMHTKNYVDKIISLLNLNENSLVIEIAANDGCLLENFLNFNIPCYGIEPTKSTAKVAKTKGIKIVEHFFSLELAHKLAKKEVLADLMIANNVLAHVPDINDFLSGFSLILKDDGVVTFEFPHLLRLVQHVQFDTIYHEHFSYLSLSTCQIIFKKNGLEIFDVEEIDTHGGSLRVYAQKLLGERKKTSNVDDILLNEKKGGVLTKTFYQKFSLASYKIKEDLIIFLNKAKIENKKVVGYGAAAKGNTLLNFGKINSDLISYVVDLNPMKIGKFLPGSHIPIVSKSKLMKDQPDFIIILPWNLKFEIIDQLCFVREWGCKFIVLQPKMEIF